MKREGAEEGIEGLTVEAWDGDRFVARTSTGGDGGFVIAVADKVLEVLFRDRDVALTIKVLAGEQALAEGERWSPGADELRFAVSHPGEPPRPGFLKMADDWHPGAHLELRAAEHPLPTGTLGTIGSPVEVTGPDEFPPTLLRLPYSPCDARGVDPRTARLFRFDAGGPTLRPVWNSGVNVAHGFI